MQLPMRRVLTYCVRRAIGQSTVRRLRHRHWLESCIGQSRGFVNATWLSQRQRHKAEPGQPHWYETELNPWKKNEQLVDYLVEGVLYQDGETCCTAQCRIQEFEIQGKEGAVVVFIDILIGHHIQYDYRPTYKSKLI